MIDISTLNFSKLNGLIPAIIVDSETDKILMLGFMNEQALKKTIETNKVTFFSRTKSALWTKGETSGNFLFVKDIITDCDNDSIIVYATPQGPTCHTGNYSCFGLEKNNLRFLGYLNDLIYQRKKALPEGSYTTELFKSGSDRIIQKVGEEATEVIIAAKNKSRREIIYESADLLFHLIVMLADNEINLTDIVDELKSRHK
ncbi:Phosphoribosyl-AMP cyclohydrolase [Ignavibacterium album JCM 16511]|uniref:Histidine biosynthesis bifunctional protein HisIE n=1 Tax=Ignavibacterium album (strain DSM 19864 / JCM 16511 / NBRC 101810 / Mat9-16) TaxID=945713 RepID=I0AGR1_IGNAJ|nr:bifunctional phosphoribosyl-AMP cyclohydrolase/phosphoribosyl-ATP diphosphatase HisIE [Ignavibacterium album]AFH48168.1 Phosphoribosyl-AMP cyclohydrolase [Ignavibacterium album JCM 16511]